MNICWLFLFNDFICSLNLVLMGFITGFISEECFSLLILFINDGKVRFNWKQASSI